MNRQTRRGTTVMVLLGTGSFLTIAEMVPAQAQNNQAVEEVVVTGSLIRGAAAVGVPVTSLTLQDFHETGALTIADVLKELPNVTVQVSNNVTNGGGELAKAQMVQIHNIVSGGPETLLTIDGIRFVPQGTDTGHIDPSIIPALAVDRVDVLADGASATYGSDAVAGVINVILKHGFDGAITQVRYGRSWDLDGSTYEASQLYGRTWDTGNVTVSYEWYNQNPEPLNVTRPYYTLNYEPFGFDDETPLGQSMPGTVSLGDPNQALDPALGFPSTPTGTRECNNCYSTPSGTGWNFGAQAPGPTTTWTNLLGNAGVKNLRNEGDVANKSPGEYHNSATFTFDQDLIYGIKFFGEAFYSNRQSKERTIPQDVLLGPTSGPAAWPVPTTNPYYPAGAPAGLEVSYDLGYGASPFSTAPSTETTEELAARYNFGFTADLPFQWTGKLYYSMSQDSNHEHQTNMNQNLVMAALGNTVAGLDATDSTAAQAAYTKPSTIPYLNLFCDDRKFVCNSPVTLAYISAIKNFDSHYQLGEFGLNLQGPVIDLPGGTVKAAVGASTYSAHQDYTSVNNTQTFDAHPVLLDDPYQRNWWAVFAQVNVPLVGDMNKLPGVEAFNIELGLRLDDYSQFGAVSTPKVSATWNVAYGLSFRGTYSKSFRAPVPGEQTAVAGALIQPDNNGSASASNLNLDCGGNSTPTPNTLSAYLNPTCNPAQQNPSGIDVLGGAGVAAPLRAGPALGPERAKNWAVGADFAPTDFLKGLNLGATWYHVHIDGVINQNGGPNAPDPNDPVAGKVCTAPGAGCVFFVRANPNLPITDASNAEFLKLASALTSSGISEISTAALPDIQFIDDVALTNVGYEEFSGIDFNARYDADFGEWGAWNVGVTGNYQLINKTQSVTGQPGVEFFTDQNPSGGRLQYRGRLGWTDDTGDDLDGLSITGFINVYPHTSLFHGRGGYTPPDCYWRTGFGPGSCYPGSPFIGPFNHYPSDTPGTHTFDLALGYQTGTRPANTYLQNLGFDLTVNNLLNTAPPFLYHTNGGKGNAADFTYLSPDQRYVVFAVTKAW